MVSSEEINRRLEARRRGVKYQEPRERARVVMESSATKECPSCHTQNPPTAKFCVGCGDKLETPEVEPEKEFSPTIKGPEEPTPEKPIQKKHKITQRPDDFNKPKKLKPIVPSEPKPSPNVEPKAPKVEPDTSLESETSATSKQEHEPTPEPQKPPQVKRPDIIHTKPKFESTPTPEPKTTETVTSEAKETSNVDPVERIKKAKELLDLGAITQEDFDKIKNKYLDEI